MVILDIVRRVHRLRRVVCSSLFWISRCLIVSSAASYLSGFSSSFLLHKSILDLLPREVAVSPYVDFYFVLVFRILVLSFDPQLSPLEVRTGNSSVDTVSFISYCFFCLHALLLGVSQCVRYSFGFVPQAMFRYRP